MNLLLLVGLGKIPVSLALMILMMSWGFVGFVLNMMVSHFLGVTTLVGFITLPLTLIISLTLTGLVAALIAKIIPVDDDAHESRQDLVGKPGEAMYDINDAFGMAKVRGSAGDFYQVNCRTASGKPPIRKGDRIVLFDYDREKNVFTVAPFDASTKTAPTAG